MEAQCQRLTEDPSQDDQQGSQPERDLDTVADGDFDDTIHVICFSESPDTFVLCGISYKR